ncbi:DUF6198 family protein [Corynebacterium cystitidis]|uniref:DUF6198 family protein n=1 Tax=Corynebacterium cystitidis TaxID=35757 RepID=UPI00211E7887|nr:DUF6198 family protein [Corynebacterium cystitidis]
MQLASRILTLVVGHAIMALGVALSLASDLGTTPISALPAVTSLISGLSVGTTTVLVNVVLVILQILILRRDYAPIQLFQLALLLYFGPFIDGAVWLLDQLGVGYSNYFQQWMLTIVGIIVVGIGVTLQVRARLFVLPGEGIAQALSFALHRRFGAKPRYEFGRVKVVTDTVQVLLALVLALVFLGGFVGVREGTIAAALAVGWVVTLCNKIVPPKAASSGTSRTEPLGVED